MTSADELVRSRGWELVIDATGVTAAIQDGLPRVAPGGTFHRTEDPAHSLMPVRRRTRPGRRGGLVTRWVMTGRRKNE